MVLLDSSEFMRNGDYVPSRMESQHDAANLLVGSKTQSNPENTVGIIAMCGLNRGADLLVSPTDDMGKILGALHGVPIRSGIGDVGCNKFVSPAPSGGGCDVTVSIQVASLALKHRRNKNGAQRIVVFVGSPLLHVDARTLAKTGRMLKKNNVAIDVVALGELEENEAKLKELVDAANGGADAERTCHMVTIPPGVLPSDVLVSSPIVHGSAGAAVPGNLEGADVDQAGGGNNFPYAGVDPNMDPELAMALRVSMEEERARQERAAAAQAAAQVNNEAKQDGADSSDANLEDSMMPGVKNEGATVEEVEVTDEDALLQQALAMSMNETDLSHLPEDKKLSSTGDRDIPDSSDVQPELMDMEDEDAAMQLALQMSMQPEPSTVDPVVEAKPAAGSGSTSGQGQFQDPQFVNQLLGSLPEVNPDDPTILNAFKNSKSTNDNKEKKNDEKE